MPYFQLETFKCCSKIWKIWDSNRSLYIFLYFQICSWNSTMLACIYILPLQLIVHTHVCALSMLFSMRIDSKPTTEWFHMTRHDDTFLQSYHYSVIGSFIICVIALCTLILSHTYISYEFYTPYCLWHAAAWREKIWRWLVLNSGLPVPLSATLPSVLSHHCTIIQRLNVVRLAIIFL